MTSPRLNPEHSPEKSPRASLQKLAGHRLVRRGSKVALIRLLGLIIVFGLQILLARLLGDSEEYGKYAWAQSLMFMLGIVSAMGVPVITGRFIASLVARGRPDGVAIVVRRAYSLLLRSALALVAVALGLAWVNTRMADSHFYLTFAIPALLFAPIACLALFYQHINQARHWYVLAYLPVQVLRPTATALFALGMWWLMDGSLSGMQVLLITGCSLALVCLPQGILFHWRQRTRPVESTPEQDIGEYRPERLFRTALPVLLSRLAAMSTEYANVLLVGLLAGPAAAGAYFAAERLAMLVAIPWTIISKVALPEFAAAFSRDDPDSLRRQARHAVKLSFAPTLLAAIPLCLFSGYLLSLFGEEFREAQPVLLLLVLGTVIQSAMGSGQGLLLMTGQQKRLPLVLWTTLAVHLSALALLLPSLGIVGAAIASVISGVFCSTWQAQLVRRGLKLNPTLFRRPGR